MLWTNQVHCW